MKRIVAVGLLDTFSQLLLGCFGTLSKYARGGSAIYLLIALETDQEIQKLRLQSIERSTRNIGECNIVFLQGFDFDRVSQQNVNLLRSFVESTDPSLVLIPSCKAVHARQRVLGSSALLACRWISNVLTYEMEDNENFTPTIFSDLTERDYSAKLKSIKEFDGDGIRDRNNMDNTEMFESHRLVLLTTDDAV